MRLLLIVQPRASRSEIAGLHDGRIRVRLAAPPVEGAANDELIALLAGKLRVSRSSIQLTAGSRGRRKAVTVSGIGVGQAQTLLLDASGPG